MPYTIEFPKTVGVNLAGYMELCPLCEDIFKILMFERRKEFDKWIMDVKRGKI